MSPKLRAKLEAIYGRLFDIGFPRVDQLPEDFVSRVKSCVADVALSERAILVVYREEPGPVWHVRIITEKKSVDQNPKPGDTQA